ncbi:MAG TPA: hypothetical protein VLX12_12000 [Syntrophorhabdales bacterium]|nr:hypothetical protein [Syntrophorhabdales bacterium]
MLAGETENVQETSWPKELTTVKATRIIMAKTETTGVLIHSLRKGPFDAAHIDW